MLQFHATKARLIEAPQILGEGGWEKGWRGLWEREGGEFGGRGSGGRGNVERQAGEREGGELGGRGRGGRGNVERLVGERGWPGRRGERRQRLFESCTDTG